MGKVHKGLLGGYSFSLYFFYSTEVTGSLAVTEILQLALACVSSIILVAHCLLSLFKSPQSSGHLLLCVWAVPTTPGSCSQVGCYVLLLFY